MIDWDAVVSHVVACTGWTWDTVLTELDLPRLNALNLYWDSHPPTHILIAAYMGVKPKQAAVSNQTNQDSSLDSLGDQLVMGEAPVFLTPEQYMAKRNQTSSEG